MEHESALDAVNEALGVTSGEAHETEASENQDAGSDAAAADENTGAESGTEGDAESTSEAGKADGEGEDGAGKGEGEGKEGESAGRERGPDGKFKKREAEGEKKPGTEGDGKPVAAAKKVDPLNDPIPKDLKQETQERIRTLIKTTREATVERERIQQDFNYMVQGVQATGASPEQYGETLSWLSLFNKGVGGDPASLEKAWELVETVAERCALLLGKDRPTNDPLKAHVDLQQAVREGKINSEYAREVARTRNSQSFRTELSTQASNQRQQQETQQQELNQARTDLSALEQTLKGSDPLYEQKRATLVPILKPIFAAIPPSQWKEKFMQAYRELKVSAASGASAGGGGSNIPARQPLRGGKNPAGGQTREPSNMLEAVSGALANMGRR